MIRETGHLPAGNRRVARTQHDPTSIKETTMTETTTPPAALSVGRLARAIYDAALATNVIPHPAWDQLDAAEIERFRVMAGLVIERLGGERAACPDPIECGHEATLGQTCVCGEPAARGIRHRTYGPCYVVEAQHRTAALAIAHTEAPLWADGEPLEDKPLWQTYLAHADAVLAVLPAPADRAAILRWAADQIDAETRQAKADGVLEPDKFRPCRDASAQLRALAGCQECGSGLEHDTHCPYPESHNWGCGCPSDERPAP